jgi:3-oxoacyl-[acyl-carrier protein] reductase
MNQARATKGALDGRRAIVTGASRGIGRRIAEVLGEAGARVALIARSESSLAQTRRLLEEKGAPEPLVVPLDVSDSAAVNAAVSRVCEAFGGLDILVNNAGLTKDQLLIRMSDADWDQVLDVDLKGVFYCCRAAARALRKSEQGRIINVSSVVALVGNAGQANYAAAKAGLHGLTLSLAKELGGKGVTVNAVCPGFIETDMTAGLGDRLRGRVLSQVPLGRLGATDDIARVVEFLCGSGASYVTGALIPVDGGMSLGSIG